MTDYRGSAQVRVSPDALFAYLSQVDNLPDYFARMRSAEPVETPTGGGSDAPRAVRTSAELPDGQVVEGEAWFEVDQDALTLKWGAEGPHDYHGELSVTTAGAGGPDDGAQVDVLISTANVESDEIQQGVDRTVATIKEKVESQHART